MTGRPAEPTDELRRSATALSRLVLRAGQGGLELTLTKITQLAVDVVPGAIGAGLTLYMDGAPDTVVGSTEFVREWVGDARWPDSTSALSRPAPGSVMCLPLSGPHGTIGVLTVYALDENAFGARANELAGLFVESALVIIQNAQVFALVQRRTVDLSSELVERSVVNQALGIVMSRVGCTAAQAAGRLRRMSRTHNQTPAAHARWLVDDAVRRVSPAMAEERAAGSTGRRLV